jgi:hypothetical protein
VAEAERLRGYNDCADGTQALLFVAGLLPYLKTFVDDRIEEDSTLDQILKRAIRESNPEGDLMASTASTPCTWRSNSSRGTGCGRQR